MVSVFNDHRKAAYLNPAGAAGNAAAATADKGRAVLEASGRTLAELLAEFDSLPAF